MPCPIPASTKERLKVRELVLLAVAQRGQDPEDIIAEVERVTALVLVLLPLHAETQEPNIPA
jgi:hypothetical protein